MRALQMVEGTGLAHRAEAKLLVTTTGGAAAGGLTTLARHATDSAVLDAVRGDLALDLSRDQLAGKISVRTENSGYIVVRVDDAAAQRAAAIANADARRLIDRIGSLRQDLRARVVEPAAVPTS